MVYTTLSVSLFMLLCVCTPCRTQSQGFALPQAVRGPSLPTVDPDLVKYFDLTGGSRSLVDMMMGPRPGLIPPATFQDPTLSQKINSALPQFPPLQNGPSSSGSSSFGFAPGTGQIPQPTLTDTFGLPAAASSFQQNQFTPQEQQQSAWQQQQAALAAFLAGPTNTSSTKQPSGPRSSIAGIPDIIPNLPKPPSADTFQRTPTNIVQNRPELPRIPERPDVPNGGLGGSGSAPFSSSIDSGPSTSARDGSGGSSNFGGGSFGSGGPDGFNNIQQSTQPGQAGLFDNLMGLLGLKNGGQPATGEGQQQKTAQLLDNLRDLVGSSAGANGGLLSNVLYNSLTEGVLLGDAANSTVEQQEGNNATIAKLRNQTGKSIVQNMALIQQVLSQPNSPLCTPKPQPVIEFNVDSFMGTWYQVLYSPPLSVGPCSMITYNKLADVAQGGPGTVFDTFEYTTESTPFGAPRISSGYAIVRAPGQLIYRTSASENDVNVNVIAVGPLNARKQYDWAALSINCNYPLHVFARDPIVYKQQYESTVNSILAQRGLTNGFSRLLNLVSPVDNTLCTFPPTLFNIQG